MAIDAKTVRELTNALQAALLLATRLEPELRQSARDAGDLRALVEKAATTVREVRPEDPRGDI